MRRLAVGLTLLAACSRPALEAEPSAVRATGPAAPVPTAPVSSPAPSHTVIGDPLGLLSRPPEIIDQPAQAKLTLDSLTSAQPRHARVPERDPRAIARARMPVASTQIRELPASGVMSELRRSSAKLRVLYLYAAYCPACREVMPNVRETAKRFYGRGVEFTAASVDRNREQYAEYVPNLQGVFPATMVSAESGAMTRELKQLGIPLQGKGFSIPLIAVLDRKDQLVAYGNTGLASRLDQALDSLSAP